MDPFFSFKKFYTGKLFMRVFFGQRPLCFIGHGCLRHLLKRMKKLIGKQLNITEANSLENSETIFG